MLKNVLILAAGLLAVSTAHAVDERALKLTEPNRPATVVTPHDLESYMGNNSAGPDWVRPFADGTCCSGLGPVKYHAQEFFLSGNDTCDLGSVQAGWDGYLFIYQTPFDPMNQTVNFVAGDDDGNGGIGTSDIMGLALTGSTSYTMVTTGFANGDVGDFTNSISCPTADVTLGALVVGPPRQVPALNTLTLALLGVLVAAVGFVVSRRKRSTINL
jgi:uncharacterized protein (DUF779 family)